MKNIRFKADALMRRSPRPHWRNATAAAIFPRLNGPRTSLIADVARAAAVATPVLDQCHRLFSESDRLGLGTLDMVAVVRAIEKHTSALRVAG